MTSPSASGVTWSRICLLLFDFYYVQPERARQKKAALNERLGEAGKKPMK
jgi:hypothetical protein